MNKLINNSRLLEKILAAYMGSEVFLVNGKWQTVSASTIQWVLQQGFQGYDFQLFPISKITDDHAIDICQMVSHAKVDRYSVLRADHFNYVEVVGEDKQGDCYGGEFRIHFDGDITWEWYNKEKEDGYEKKISLAYQQLALWGYAIPLQVWTDHEANGMTAIQMKLAKERI